MKIFALVTLGALLLSGCGGGGTDSGTSTDSGTRHSMHKKAIDVFGVQVYATAAVPDDTMLYAAKIMAEYLDQDNNGVADNALLNSAMRNRGSCIGVTTGERAIGCQSLYTFEAIPSPVASGQNATYEEVLHTISEGYGAAYPNVFGERIGTTIGKLMDKARGGYQGAGQPVSAYPEGAWYTYKDPTCDYSCMVTEYFYWGLTSMMGLQGHRCAEMQVEWDLCTRSLVQSKDPELFALLSNSTGAYGIPQTRPDGVYSALPLTIVHYE
jgi:hypothetical protein